MKEDTLMKKLKALLLTVFIVLMLFASCDNGIRTLGEENIKMLSSVTEDAFAQFDTLSSGSKELKSNGYTGTATLSVENGKWSMHITGEDAEGFAIDYTITQDDVESDSTVRVKIGDVTYDASASALFSGSELPKNPLTDAELAIFKEAVNAAFDSMDYLETKNDGSFTLSDGTECTFSITVAGTSWTLTVNSAIGDSQYTLIVTDTTATLSYNNAQYSLDRSDIMTGVKVPDLPPTELEEDVITLLSSTLKEAFSKFDYLQTGKQSFDYEGYSVTANLSVTDVDTRAWTMHIEATGDQAFSFTVNSDQSPITVTYDGRGYQNVLYDSLMAGIEELPADPIPEELDAEQIADLKGITEAAFNAFTLLENGQASAKYETYSITATLSEVSTDRWTMNISATGEDEYTYSYAITSEKYEDGTIQVTYRDTPYSVSASAIASDIVIPPLPKTALTEEELKVVNQALKDAFAAFRYLESGSVTTESGVTANLAVGSDDSWTMSITAAGSLSFSFTITNSNTDVDVTYKGEGPFKTSYASLMEGVDEYIPDRKPTALTDEQYVILNGSLIDAFGNFDKLETKDNISFSYGGFDGTASLEVEADFSWTITLDGSNADLDIFSFSLASTDESITVYFNDIPLPADAEKLMANVELPPREMTGDEISLINEVLSTAFSNYDLLSTDTKDFVYDDYTGSSTLSVDRNVWTLRITAESSSSGSISIKINSSETVGEVKIGDTKLFASYDELMHNVSIPKTAEEYATEYIPFLISDEMMSAIMTNSSTGLSVTTLPKTAEVTQGSDAKNLVNGLEYQVTFTDYQISENISVSGSMNLEFYGLYKGTGDSGDVWKLESGTINVFSYSISSTEGLTFNENGRDITLSFSDYDGFAENGRINFNGASITSVENISGLKHPEEGSNDIITVDGEDVDYADISETFDKSTCDPDFRMLAAYFIWPAHSRYSNDLDSLLTNNVAAGARKGMLVWNPQDGKNYEYVEDGSGNGTLTFYLKADKYNFDGTNEIRRASGIGALSLTGTVSEGILTVKGFSFIPEENTTVELFNLGKDFEIEFTRINGTVSGTLTFDISNTSSVTRVQSSGVKFNYSRNEGDWGEIRFADGRTLDFSTFMTVTTQIVLWVYR